MSIKKSVMISDESVDYIEARNLATKINWSRSVNDALGELGKLYEVLLPPLTLDQWQVILDCYAGPVEVGTRPARIASDLLDHCGEVDLEALSEHYRETVLRVHQLNQAEQMAVLDVVRRFWLRSRQDSEESLATRLELLAGNESLGLNHGETTKR